MGAALLVALLLAACGRGQPAPNTISVAGRPPDRSICATIDGFLFAPTVPATGETVTTRDADRVEGLLREARSTALRSEARPLESAIDADDTSGIVAVLRKLQQGACSGLGVPPPT